MLQWRFARREWRAFNVAAGGPMQDLFDEFGHPTWLPFSVVVARLMLATLLGAAIGFERE